MQRATYGRITGPPDFRSTEAKTFPPYVYSKRGGACLVHRVARMTLRWWDWNGSGPGMVRLADPIAHVFTACGQFFLLKPSHAQACTVPSPDALPCGRCQGLGPTFPKHRGARAKGSGLTRREAHVRLGCVVQVGEVRALLVMMTWPMAAVLVYLSLLSR